MEPAKTAGSKIWQVAFLSGIAACIVSAILILGTSIFATVLTVSTLFIGILNALLGQASAGAKGENWFVSTTRHALDVGTFLKVATVVVWIGAAGLIG